MRNGTLGSEKLNLPELCSEPITFPFNALKPDSVRFRHGPERAYPTADQTARWAWVIRLAEGS
jgi:hypothetical protein